MSEISSNIKSLEQPWLVESLSASSSIHRIGRACSESRSHPIPCIILLQVANASATSSESNAFAALVSHATGMIEQSGVMLERPDEVSCSLVQSAVFGVTQSSPKMSIRVGVVAGEGLVSSSVDSVPARGFSRGVPPPGSGQNDSEMDMFAHEGGDDISQE